MLTATKSARLTGASARFAEMRGWLVNQARNDSDEDESSSGFLFKQI